MSNDHIEMILKSIEAFQNGNKMDASELTEIIEIAERDGVIDQHEIRVLRSIVTRIDPNEVDSELRAVMRSLSEKVNRSD